MKTKNKKPWQRDVFGQDMSRPTMNEWRAQRRIEEAEAVLRDKLEKHVGEPLDRIQDLINGTACPERTITEELDSIREALSLRPYKADRPF